MTFVVALREARRWRRLWPLWSPQQRERRSSFVGLPNLWINSCLPRAFCCCDLLDITCISLSPSLSSHFLGFGLDLRSGDLSASKEQPQHVTLPLGSGVVSYRSHKIHFSTCSTFPVGVGTSNSLRWNFWRRREFWLKLSGLPIIADKWLWVLCRIFLDTPIHPLSRHCLDPFNWYQSKVFF